MATDKLVMGEEPSEESLNGQHVHLVNFMCDELWTMADDREDEQSQQYEHAAEFLMTSGGTPNNADLLPWLRSHTPQILHAVLNREATRIGWPFLQEETRDSDSTPGEAVEAVMGHPHWAQLQEVVPCGRKSQKAEQS